jgi:hypothetical protein
MTKITKSPKDDKEAWRLVSDLHEAIDTVAQGYDAGNIALALMRLLGRALGVSFKGSKEELANYILDLETVLSMTAFEHFDKCAEKRKSNG